MEKEKIDKQEIDKLLSKYKAEPVGNGYIDIIVPRENYQNFAQEITDLGITIEAISWWDFVEYDQDGNPSRKNIGMGGPKSKYYSGCYFEVCTEESMDELPKEADLKNQQEEVSKIIENKVIELSDGSYSYKDYLSLTPAFWLKVPKEWRSN